ncbi:MAG: Rpn family recombination-promoting nuclease/putative transposase [Roseivirga sp.]
MLRTKNDSFFKRSLEHPVIAQAFFGQYLPEYLKPFVALEALKRADRTSTNAQLKQRHRDIIYESPAETYHTFLACAERQGQPDRMILVRVLRYDADVIESYVQKHQKWPLVVNIVFTQAAAWPCPSMAQEGHEFPTLDVQELCIRSII